MLLRYAVWINKTKSASTGRSTTADAISDAVTVTVDVAIATISAEAIRISKEFVGMCARFSRCLLVHLISITIEEKIHTDSNNILFISRFFVSPYSQSKSVHIFESMDSKYLTSDRILAINYANKTHLFSRNLTGNLRRIRIFGDQIADPVVHWCHFDFSMTMPILNLFGHKPHHLAPQINTRQSIHLVENIQIRINETLL